MAAVYCYEGIPLRFLPSLLIADALSSVYEISMETTSCARCLKPVFPYRIAY